MIEQVMAADARPAVRVCIVAPAEYAHVGEVLWKEVAQPVDAVGAVARCPRLLVLDDWVGAFAHYLQAL